MTKIFRTINVRSLCNIDPRHLSQISAPESWVLCPMSQVSSLGLQGPSLDYPSIQFFIIKCDINVLQGVTGIKKCDRKIMQNVTDITKCD